jgi:hypothetical protein
MARKQKPPVELKVIWEPVTDPESEQAVRDVFKMLLGDMESQEPGRDGE